MAPVFHNIRLRGLPGVALAPVSRPTGQHRRDWIPRVINTDKNPAYGEAIAELKKEGLLPKDRKTPQHRQVKYLNNHLECDHGKSKAPDQTDARLPVDEDGLCNDQRLRGECGRSKRQCILLEPGVTGEVRFVNKSRRLIRGRFSRRR